MPNAAKADTPVVEDKDSLLKEAADALELAQRKEDATKLAFALVERGKIPPFESFEAFQEKVASLLDKDLAVVAQALELDVDLPDMGKVAADSSTAAAFKGGVDAATASFFHTLAD